MLLDIKDAPFTDDEKETIIAMGVVKADWGHPDVLLDDPVMYFQELFSDTKKLIKKGGAGTTHYESSDDVPFGG